MAKFPNVDYGLRRFAVLHHTGVEEPHFDLVFDTSDQSQLITFRLKQWPLLESQDAMKLRDHRRAYLQYTGLVSGDRGRVDRVDEGEFRVIETASGWLLNHPDDRPFALFEPLNGESEPEWFVRLLELRA